MPFAFNETLWNLGRQIEDTTLPIVNEFFKCDFKRNENNIWDVEKYGRMATEIHNSLNGDKNV